jgi:glycosyltransferase involved in cell wall biosynthesis
MRPTLHVIGLPHTSTTRAYEWCAYTAKTRRFATMMTGLGYEVVLYGGPENEAECAEHVPCISRSRQARLFGRSIPPFDHTHPGFAWFAERAIAAIGRRAHVDDLLCPIGGVAQAPIVATFPEMTVAEWGVGYGGILAHSFRCFESYAWMHTVYGSFSGGDAHRLDGRFYDTVIPNSYEPDDFPEGKGEGGYLLYMGRLTERKGLAVVRDVVERTGVPLIVAGSGDRSLLPPEANYVGVVGPAERAVLMGAATALICPTQYIEPFGGVAVEAQLCGTPAIAVPWGAFPETIEDGRTGFLCHTLAEFATAVARAPSLDRAHIRARARRLYSTRRAARLYDRWFRSLAGLRDGHDWYA